MSAKTKSHYVTRAYLDLFAPSEEDPRLYVYQRKCKGFFRNTAKNLARIQDYYGIRKKEKEEAIDNRIEVFLANHVEGPGLPIIKRLSQGNYQPNWDDRHRLTTLIALQEFRVPWVRENIEKTFSEALDQFTRFALRIPGYLERTLEDLYIEEPSSKKVAAGELREAYLGNKFVIRANPAESLRIMLRMAMKLTPLYAQMKWTVQLARPNELGFVTSDCPVHRFYRGPARRRFGILDQDVEMRFPLSKRAFLVMAHDQKKTELFVRLKDRGREREARRLMERTPQVNYYYADSALVKSLNEQTIQSANRWTYSPFPNPAIEELLQQESSNLYFVFRTGPNGLMMLENVYPRDRDKN